MHNSEGSALRHYSERMRADPTQGPDDGLGDGWAAALADLARACARAEEALFATVPVLGDPLTQRRVDEVIDHGVDVLRDLADLAREIAERHAMSRSTLGARQSDVVGDTRVAGRVAVRGEVRADRPVTAPASPPARAEAP